MSLCKVGQLADALPVEDRDTLAGWLDTGLDGKGREVPATAMARALTAEGHRVGPTTVKGHRARACACYREG